VETSAYLLLALKDHLENYDEPGSSLTVSIGERCEDEANTWPAQYYECGDLCRCRLFTSICVECGKEIMAPVVGAMSVQAECGYKFLSAKISSRWFSCPPRAVIDYLFGWRV
jgi:hypothetical protein